MRDRMAEKKWKMYETHRQTKTERHYTPAKKHCQYNCN